MKTYLVVLSALVLTTTAISQPGRGPMHRPGGPPPREAIIERLNLTDAQQSQMRKLHLDLMKKQTPLRSKIQTLRLEIQEQFLADKVDRAAIEKNLKAISDTQHQMKLNWLDHWYQVNAILTPEQQKIWKEAPGMFGARVREAAGRGMRMMMHRHWWDDEEDED
ncbi:MAG TPA: Spy/CpxP family protein refolding chaperone [Bacteroidota bacterium]|nr:Spy/CpxP family protein refolding chaperone [Bacteroidota bacterium]